MKFKFIHFQTETEFIRSRLALRKKASFLGRNKINPDGRLEIQKGKEATEMINTWMILQEYCIN